MIIEMQDVDKVKPYEQNVKLHSDEQVAKIAKSISQFGWDQPVVVDKNGVIIKGHGRTLAARKLGMKQIPVLVRDDLNDEQVMAARVADNRVAIGDVDTQLLQKEMERINIEDLKGIFDDKELKFLLDSDLGEINDEGFAVDLYGDIERQTTETLDKIDSVDERPVRIAEALGFKEISGKDERVVARFVALMEEATGKTGADAFVEYARAQLEKDSE